MTDAGEYLESLRERTHASLDNQGVWPLILLEGSEEYGSLAPWLNDSLAEEVRRFGHEVLDEVFIWSGSMVGQSLGMGVTDPEFNEVYRYLAGFSIRMGFLGMVWAGGGERAVTDRDAAALTRAAWADLVSEARGRPVWWLTGEEVDELDNPFKEENGGNYDS